jgi:hypothetical protein
MQYVSDWPVGEEVSKCSTAVKDEMFDPASIRVKL